MLKPWVKTIASWYILVLIGATFPSAVYYNFSSVKLSQVDEASRLKQAKEILGKRFYGSLAHKLKGDVELNYRIYQKVKSSLPDHWKDNAEQMTEVLISESQKQGLDPIFILAVIQTESMFNPETVGAAGEIGLMQILPGTGKWMAEVYGIPWDGKWVLFDPAMNVRLGITYFAHLREEFDGKSGHYITAYNMGTANVRKLDRRRKKLALNNHYLKLGYGKRVTANYAKIYRELYQDKMNRHVAGSLQSSQ